MHTDRFSMVRTTLIVKQPIHRKTQKPISQTSKLSLKPHHPALAKVFYIRMFEQKYGLVTEFTSASRDLEALSVTLLRSSNNMNTNEFWIYSMNIHCFEWKYIIFTFSRLGQEEFFVNSCKTEAIFSYMQEMFGEVNAFPKPCDHHLLGQRCSNASKLVEPSDFKGSTVRHNSWYSVG